ncbi:reverse transcriptase (RNA-dependent DNA polymerase) [Legionella taurinensis]|nr:reverse transcriptase (RNA-dependent DNA polymerase) [Legionella taurinensis]
MLNIGRKLFAKIHKQKHHAHHNHDIHFLARELDDWLVEGIHALIDGSYTPRFLKRCYFPDEMIDQLHLSDRILQHVLLHQLKPTFPFVMNPNCYHLHGPSGVKYATEQVKKVLEEKKPKYLIRADIKSHYHDPKLNLMLERIIVNPIETPRGYKNPDTGIALRGPLSQFFSALYLKPLDDAFNEMDVAYFRYQDDILSYAKPSAVSIDVSSVSCRCCRKGVCACLVKKRVSAPSIGLSFFRHPISKDAAFG